MKITFIALSLVLAVAMQAQLPDPTTLNTGAGVDVVGVLDPYWQVASGDSLQPTSDFVAAAVVGNCDNLWFNSGTSYADWITYDQGSGCYHLGSTLDLYFQRRIVLPDTNHCGRPVGEVFCFDMAMNADNCVYEVLVNSVSNFQYMGSVPPLQFDGLQNTVTAHLCEGWQGGENLLTIHVKSNPTAVGLLAVAKQKTFVSTYHFLGNDTTLCSATPYQLTSSDTLTRWFDNSMGGSKTVERSGLYWASRLDGEGCEVRDTVTIQFTTGFYVPNAFSPNGDGLNDAFAPAFADAPPTDYLLQVFDRWGSRVFQSHDPNKGWDGSRHEKDCTAGIYAYLIRTGKGACREMVSGDVLLVR